MSSGNSFSSESGGVSGNGARCCEKKTDSSIELGEVDVARDDDDDDVDAMEVQSAAVSCSHGMAVSGSPDSADACSSDDMTSGGTAVAGRGGGGRCKPGGGR